MIALRVTAAALFMACILSAGAGAGEQSDWDAVDLSSPGSVGGEKAPSAQSAMLPLPAEEKKLQEQEEKKLNINTATPAQLAQISGLNADLAQRIVIYRDAHGEFASIWHLTLVAPITSAMVEGWKPLLTVGRPSPDTPPAELRAITESDSSARPGSQSSSKKKIYKKGKPEGKININTADNLTLQQLPGVGPAIAKRIIDYREKHGPYKKIEDIQKVYGIGARSFDGMKEYLAISE